MTKVGITGQSGFIGSHLYHTLKLNSEFEVVEYDKRCFDNPENLDDFVAACDVIVHLAAKNRHYDDDVIYQTNVGLATKLKESLLRTNSAAHVLFSSSTQEERDNVYGRSKKEARQILENWASQGKGTFKGLVIPNVFGPFGNPFYNSVVATFCHQLNHDETPKIDIDGELKLIYVDELVSAIIQEIRKRETVPLLQIPFRHTAKVSEILQLLEKFKALYNDRGIIPPFGLKFERDLFNTFRSYIDLDKFFPFHLNAHKDDRGEFVEIVRLGTGGQVSFSTTKPGITRGNHFHTRKIERFAVIRGEANIQLRRIGTERVFNFNLNGSKPAFVDMPIWYTHNITNVGSEDLYTVFWINEQYDVNDPDTFMEKV